MGNCQAIDAAALVIQHPSGKIERLYWTISASEVMRLNPGHYVSLIIPLTATESGSDHHHQEEEMQEQKGGGGGGGGTVRFTRVKLLRPNEILALGHAYRLVTTQEVMEVLRAKKYAKTKKLQVESLLERTSRTAVSEKQNSSCDETENKENISHATNHERRPPRTASGNAAGAVMRSKSWRPSLQSISEAGS
ncbi:uncharacterized protein LOC126791374 [Argentina anserina]|uniref:uncharacterized protein LOC126791374 n=1 Tax=Argentina anserina TaxID=57926 RepID=UPI0021762C2A|nr:uncharacterized protein LOC126791374 [Potentilla anserina]